MKTFLSIQSELNTLDALNNSMFIERQKKYALTEELLAKLWDEQLDKACYVPSDMDYAAMCASAHIEQVISRGLAYDAIQDIIDKLNQSTTLIIVIARIISRIKNSSYRNILFDRRKIIQNLKNNFRSFDDEENLEFNSINALLFSNSKFYKKCITIK